MSENPDSGELDIANVIKLPLQDITYEVKCMLIKNRLPDNCEKSIIIFKKLEKNVVILPQNAANRISDGLKFKISGEACPRTPLVKTASGGLLDPLHYGPSFQKFLDPPLIKSNLARSKVESG